MLDETILDGLGKESAREVLVDDLKSRFFVLGLQVGVSLQMFVLAIIIMVIASVSKVEALHELSLEYYPTFSVFSQRCCRSLFLICFFAALHGINLFIWKRFGIGYRRILGVDYNHNYHFMIRASLGLACIVFLFYCLYVLTLTSSLTPNQHIWPAAAVISVVLYSVIPFDLCGKWNGAKQRFSLCCTILAVLISPFSEVTFGRSFVADILTSMPKIFTDLLFTGCIYSTQHYNAVGHFDPADAAYCSDQTQ